MKTGKNQQNQTGRLRMLVLVPHRDARLPLKAWSASLFAAGVPGAWAFPWVAPLAVLNRPLLTGEIKPLARALRQHIEGNGSKLTADPPVLSALSSTISVFGPSLRIELADSFYKPVIEAINRRVSPLVIGSALVLSNLPDVLPPPPFVSFRAAALANMSYLEKSGDLFKWEIGPLHWLPKKVSGA